MGTNSTGTYTISTEGTDNARTLWISTTYDSVFGDPITYSPLESLANISVKESVRVASVSDINLLLPVTIIDGVNLEENDRVLLKNQVDLMENGFYRLNEFNMLERTSDAVVGSVSTGTFSVVTEGVVNRRTLWLSPTYDAVFGDAIVFESLLSGGGGGSPGGVNTNIQYNNLGNFGGISSITTDGTNMNFSSADLSLDDNSVINIGTSNDLVLEHNSINSVVTSNTGDLIFSNDNVTGDTIIKLGTNDSNTSMRITDNVNVDLFTILGDGVSEFTTSIESPVLIINNGVDDTNIVRAPGGSTHTLTLPNALGTNGQILSTDGSGVLSWIDDSGGSPGGVNTNIQFNDSGNFGGVNALSFNGVDQMTVGTEGTLFTIGAADATTLNAAGGDVVLDGGTGDGTGNGGNVALRSGTSGNGLTGNAGGVFIIAEDSSATDGNGGSVSIQAGDGNGTGSAGSIDIISGEGGSSTDGGNINLSCQSGGVGGDANGGSIGLFPGNSVSVNGNGGNVTVSPGSGTGTGVDGQLTIQGETTKVTTVSTKTGTVAYTAAELQGGIILHDPDGSSVTATLPIASDIIDRVQDAVTGALTGSSFKFTIENTADADETITLSVPDASVILQGDASNYIISENQSRQFEVVFTGVAQVTIYSIGVGGSGFPGSPGGVNTNIQFNDSGNFGGTNELTWDGSTFTMGTGAVLDILNTTESTNSTTGAVVISGGVGIAKNLNCAATITADTYVTTSDRRQKYDIHTLVEASKIIKRMRPVQYRLKKSDHLQYGVIAQEFQEIGLDHLVESNGSHLGVNYLGIIGLLIQSNQELLHRVEKLEKLVGNKGVK